MSTTMAALRVCQADYARSDHAAALVMLLDAYASDIAGGGEPLSAYAKAHLVSALASRPQAYSVLAFDGEQPVGLVNCIEGFSTFACLHLRRLDAIRREAFAYLALWTLWRAGLAHRSKPEAAVTATQAGMNCVLWL